MITVPVVLQFDQDKTIGYMEIDETKLPATPHFCFSIGCKILSMNDQLKADKYELRCISVQDDAAYKQYLESEQYEKF